MKDRNKHKRNPHRIIPEHEVKKSAPNRCGFVPNHFDDDNPDDVELWQIWLHSHDGEEVKRATFGDLEAAGFKVKGRA